MRAKQKAYAKGVKVNGTGMSRSMRQGCQGQWYRGVNVNGTGAKTQIKLKVESQTASNWIFGFQKM